MLEESTIAGAGEHREIHLPPPSYWPPVAAVGFAAALAGIVVHPLVWIAGLLIVAISLAGWFGEIGRDLREAPAEPQD